jgi:Putative abortive phage resistance protein AbiGi, antitoxin
MAISTNSVIHYTQNLDSLIGIINCTGFKFKYCFEEYSFHKMNNAPAALPMVSFCDIPISEVKNHIDSYGSYGIGLNKSWAKNSGLNPVLYVEKTSALAKMFYEHGQRLVKLKKEAHDAKIQYSELQNYYSYIKNYEGRLVRGKVNDENYRFYNEREWRYVPTKDEIKYATLWIDGKTYIKDKEKYNQKISDCYLKFSHADISYLIVDTDDEIPSLLDTLNKVFEDTATAKELRVLATRIMTKNQIWNDF